MRGSALGAVALAGGYIAVSALGSAKVAVEIVARREIVQTLVVSGRVEPWARVHVGGLILGRAQSVAVQQGQVVKPGQVLVQIADDEARAAVLQAKASVQQARARLDQVCDYGAPAALKELNQAEIALQQTETDYERQLGLFQAGVVTQSQFETSRTALQLARSAQDAAALRALNLSCEGTEHRLAVAALMQNEAAMAAAQARLAQTVLTSPVEATVLSREVEPGDIVQPGKTLLVLAQNDKTRISVPLDEKSLGLVAIGQKAMISADAYPDRHFTCTLVRIAPVVDVQRGTIEITFEVDDRPDYLRSDMTVSVDIEVGRKLDAVVVPLGAVREAASAEPWVLVAADGRAERRPIRLGLRDGQRAEVLTGIEVGDAVILPVEEIAAGQSVDPVAVSGPAPLAAKAD